MLFTVFILKQQVCPKFTLSTDICLALILTIVEEPVALVEQIHKAGMKAGVAISPDTPSTAITDEVANAADMLLVMTVYPGLRLFRAYALPCNSTRLMLSVLAGRGGQKFLERCVPKVAELRSRFPDKDIEVDGGVGPSTVDVCAHAGEHILFLLQIYALMCEHDVFRIQRDSCWNGHIRR